MALKSIAIVYQLLSFIRLLLSASYIFYLKGMLPVRWMAIESLEDYIYTTQTDLSYPAFQSHSHYLKLPGIRLSRWKMESAPWFSQWLSCSACCGCSARFQIGRLCCRLMFRAWLSGY